MTKNEIITAVAEKTDSTKTAAEMFYRAMSEAIVEGLLVSGRVEIQGLGIFEVSEAKERKGRNPQTGEGMVIPARNKVKFKPAKSLREKV